jgi:hypothetical protein
VAGATRADRHPVAYPCAARPELQAAKRAGAAPPGRREVPMPDRDADPEKPEAAGEPDWRRLLDGYAEPGRLRRLKDRQQRRQSARRGRLRRWVWRLRWRRSR